MAKPWSQTLKDAWKQLQDPSKVGQNLMLNPALAGPLVGLATAGESARENYEELRAYAKAHDALGAGLLPALPEHIPGLPD